VGALWHVCIFRFVKIAQGKRGPERQEKDWWRKRFNWGESLARGPAKGNAIVSEPSKAFKKSMKPLEKRQGRGKRIRDTLSKGCAEKSQKEGRDLYGNLYHIERSQKGTRG